MDKSSYYQCQYYCCHNRKVTVDVFESWTSRSPCHKQWYIFSISEFTDYVKANRIQHVITVPYHPAPKVFCRWCSTVASFNWEWWLFTPSIWSSHCLFTVPHLPSFGYISDNDTTKNMTNTDWQQSNRLSITLIGFSIN